MVETLVTLSVMAGLMAATVPTLRDIQQRWKVQQAVSSMESTLMFARSEAIRRGGGVGVEKITGTPHCQHADTAQQWSCGWVVFADTNNNGTRQPLEAKLHEVTLTGEITVTRKKGKSFKVNRYGMVDGLNADSFLFTHIDRTSASHAHMLCMSSGGRIRIVQGKTECN